MVLGPTVYGIRSARRLKDDRVGYSKLLAQNIFLGFCLGTVLKLVLKLSQLSSTPYCLLYTPTLLLCLSVCISLSLSPSLSSFHSSLVEIDGLCIRAQALASDEWKEFWLSPWPFNPGRFKFRETRVALIDLCEFIGWRKNVGLSCVISNNLFCCSFE